MELNGQGDSGTLLDVWFRRLRCQPVVVAAKIIERSVSGPKRLRRLPSWRGTANRTDAEAVCDSKHQVYTNKKVTAPGPASQLGATIDRFTVAAMRANGAADCDAPRFNVRPY